MKRSPCGRGCRVGALVCSMLCAAAQVAAQTIGAPERRAEAALSGIVSDPYGSSTVEVPLAEPLALTLAPAPTLRDDAPEPIRDQVTADLRELVLRHSQSGRRLLIVPLPVSFGGIDKGLRERLHGLSYALPDAALMPDHRLVSWVLATAEAR